MKQTEINVYELQRKNAIYWEQFLHTVQKVESITNPSLIDILTIRYLITRICAIYRNEKKLTEAEKELEIPY